MSGMWEEERERESANSKQQLEIYEVLSAINSNIFSYRFVHVTLKQDLLAQFFQIPSVFAIVNLVCFYKLPAVVAVGGLFHVWLSYL